MAKDLFAARYKAANRSEIDNGVEEFLKNGGKITKLVDSREAEVIEKPKHTTKVIGAVHLFSREERLTKKD